MCESGAQVGALCPPWANQKWQTPAHSATNLSPPQHRLHSRPLIAARRTGLQGNRHITLLTLEGANGVIAEHPSSNYLGMFQHSRVAPAWRVEGSSPEKTRGQWCSVLPRKITTLPNQKRTVCIFHKIGSLLLCLKIFVVGLNITLQVLFFYYVTLY